MQTQDTICGLSTPPGVGGIGIIRISGRDAVRLADRFFKPRRNRQFADSDKRSLQYGHIIDPTTGETVDEVLLSIMRAPATYTREDIVEINCHGGPIPLWRTMTLLVTAGARQAEPGEFTLRAFLNGRIDLAQAEAVMDVIHARTELAHRAAKDQLLGGLSGEVTSLRDGLISLLAAVEAGIDFPEEDIETGSNHTMIESLSGLLKGIDGLLAGYDYGRILRDGFATAIVGKPNVGKSSLLNALLKQDRAIVTEIPGTTRDVLEEYVNISGVPLKILDTAGIRHSHDVVEQEGIRRSMAAIDSADLVLPMLDGSRPLTDEDRRVLEMVQGKQTIIIINKADLPRRLELSGAEIQVSISCRTGEGLDVLKQAVLSLAKLGRIGDREHSPAVNLRHKTALEQARTSLQRSYESVTSGLSSEFIAMDLRGALESLGLIIGATYTEDILEKIFSDFCIGK